jgi:imidazole glycerol phosphate synthase subunit HisF
MAPSELYQAIWKESEKIRRKALFGMYRLDHLFLLRGAIMEIKPEINLEEETDHRVLLDILRKYQRKNSAFLPVAKKDSKFVDTERLIVGHNKDIAETARVVKRAADKISI